MKKALWLIAALVLALAMVGCDQESIEISKLPQGSDNFDFEGKTLVQLAPTYGTFITKSSTAGASKTTSTIYLTQETSTYVFGEDGNFTYSSTETYTPAADGQYVDGVVSGVSYIGGQYYLSGFAGKTISTSVTTGTWYQYKDKKSDAEDVTKILMTDSVTTTSTYTPDNFGTSVVIRTYAAGTNYTTITNHVGDPSKLTYSYGGETTDGRDVWNIGTRQYVVQE